MAAIDDVHPVRQRTRAPGREDSPARSQSSRTAAEAVNGSPPKEEAAPKESPVTPDLDVARALEEKLDRQGDGRASSAEAAARLGGRPARHARGPLATFAAHVGPALGTDRPSASAGDRPRALRDGVVDVVVKNFGYFRKNPRHLAWAMMQFELIHRISRRFLDACHDNPKDVVVEAGEKLKKAKDADLLYDAWAVTVANEDAFPDPGRGEPGLGLAKPNKTLEDWIAIKTDSRYEYRSLYPDAWSVKNYLLCVIGTGYGWNRAGFIAEVAPGDTDKSIFAGYTTAEQEVRADLRDEIAALRDAPLIRKHIPGYMKAVEVNWGTNSVEKRIVNRSWRVDAQVTEAGLARSEAAKVREAYRYVAYLDELLSSAGRWTPAEWEEARKSNVWMYRGVAFDVGEVTLDSRHSAYGMEEGFATELRDSGQGADYRRDTTWRSERRSKWREFVHRIDDENAPDVEQARTTIMRSVLSGLKSAPGGDVPTEADEAAARAVLALHKPNLAEYAPLLERAEAGDPEAMRALDRVSGVPGPGWDSIAAFVDSKKRQDEMFRPSKGGDGARAHYPLSQYSLLVTMPKNAHESYVRCGIEIAREILANPNDSAESKRYAERFLAKWEPGAP